MLVEFGPAIKSAVARHGLSLTEVAAEAGIGFDRLSHGLHGRRKLSPDERERVFAALERLAARKRRRG